MMMAKQGIETVTPSLRFPEFRGKNGWQVKPLGSICEVQNNRRRPITSNDRVPGPYPYYGASGVVDSVNDYIFDERLLLVGEDGAKWGRFESTAFIAEGKYWVNNHAHVLKAIELKDPLLENYLTMLDIAPFVTGAAPPKLTLAKLKSIPIPVPPASTEQQKIADCLTSLDEVIAAQGQKVAALKAHKRGLMQQLFPREGETRPRLRFPEFRNAPEWKLKLGSALFENRKERGEEGLPIYSVTINDGMIPRASFDRNFYDIEDPAKNKKACKGDIAYNMMRMWQGAQGVAVEDCMVSPAYVVLLPREGVCSNFFDYLFKLSQSLELLTAYSRGLTKDRLRLYFDDFARMPLCVPGYPEQQRVAKCLSSLDTQITAEANQLAALKTHKQGLMQQLFPAPQAASA